MKKIILGIIIGIILSTGTAVFASSAIKLVMVPEYTGGYKTTDLLEYVAKQKATLDLIETKRTENPREQTKVKTKTVCCSA